MSLKVRMYQLKRNYINDKYALVKKNQRGGYEPFFMYEAKPTVRLFGCVNEDFRSLYKRSHYGFKPDFGLDCDQRKQQWFQ